VNDSNASYSIGEFARIVGYIPETVRVWETQGLLVRKLLPDGRRVFSDDDVRTVLGMIPSGPVYTTTEFAGMIGCHPSTVYKLFQRGVLDRHTSFTGRHFFTNDDVRAILGYVPVGKVYRKATVARMLQCTFADLEQLEVDGKIKSHRIPNGEQVFDEADVHALMSDDAPQQTYSLIAFTKKVGMSISRVRRWEQQGIITRRQLPDGRRVFNDTDVEMVLANLSANPALNPVAITGEAETSSPETQQSSAESATSARHYVNGGSALSDANVHRRSRAFLPAGMYSLTESARILGCHRATLRQWERDGVLVPQHLLDGRAFYTEADLSVAKALLPNAPEGTYSMAEFANKIGRSVSSVKCLVRNGLIVPQRLSNGRVFFTEDDVRAARELSFPQGAYTVDAFTKAIGCSRTTLRRWEELGQLVPQRLANGRAFYTEDDVSLAQALLSPALIDGTYTLATFAKAIGKSMTTVSTLVHKGVLVPQHFADGRMCFTEADVLTAKALFPRVPEGTYNKTEFAQQIGRGIGTVKSLLAKGLIVPQRLSNGRVFFTEADVLRAKALLRHVPEGMYNKTEFAQKIGRGIGTVTRLEHNGLIVPKRFSTRRVFYTEDDVSLAKALLLNAPEDTYTVDAFTKAIGCSRTTLRRWEELGQLVPQRLANGRPFYTEAHVSLAKALLNRLPEGTYTMTEFAKKIGRCLPTVKSLERKGVITPHHLANGRVFYTEDDVRAVEAVFPPKGTYNAHAFARVVGCSPGDLLRWERNGQLPPHHLANGRVFYTEDDVSLAKALPSNILPAGTYTAREFATKIGRSVNTVETLVRKGMLTPQHLVGGKRFFTDADVTAALAIISPEGTYTLAEFIAQVGCCSNTVWKWQQRGLISPQRLANGHRCYTNDDVAVGKALLKRLPPEGMYSVSQFAEAIGRSVETVNRLVREGIIVPHRLRDNRMFFTEDDVRAVATIIPPKGAYTMTEFATAVGCDRSTLLKWQHEGKLAPHRLANNRPYYIETDVPVAKALLGQTA
jgi:DNA-binding transcriptional MerR regulator